MNTMNASRYSRHLLEVQKLVPQTIILEDDKFSIEKKNKNMQLLEDCRRMYDALAPFRAKRRRNRNYAFGKQWEDLMPDPDDCSGKLITEREYMLREGKVPLENNLIRKLIKIVLGLYRNDRKEPMAISRDKDESQLGDMMSVALQYAYQVNEAFELNTRNLEEAMISGMAISSVRFKWNRERQLSDIYISNENPSRVFFNGDVSDVRMNDIRTIGFLRDYTIDELLSDFATNELERAKILSIFNSNTAKSIASSRADALKSTQLDVMDFFIPYESDKYRVIEVWTLETKPRLRIFDPASGEIFVTETSAEKYITDINSKRVEEMINLGGKAENAALMNVEWFVDSFWVCRYLSPMGDELLAVETPYTHLSHPYTLRCYPMFDGEIHSFVEDIIPQQRYINRYITMMDFIRGASAKGVMIFPEELIPKGVSRDEICKTWVKSNGVIFAQMKPGVQMPQQFNSTAVNAGDVEMLQLQMQLLEDISGVHAALSGKSAKASTPSSLYAQEAQNASINLLDIMEWFEGFVKARDYKMLKVIQQYYNDGRYINIAGHDYDDSAKWYDPIKIKNSEFDLTISQSTATPAYRLMMNDTLQQLLAQGLIDLKMFLRSSKLPFADKMLRDVEMNEERAAAGGELQLPEMDEATNKQIENNRNQTAQQLIAKALSNKNKRVA